MPTAAKGWGTDSADQPQLRPVNTAYGRLLKNDVRYRLIVEMERGL